MPLFARSLVFSPRIDPQQLPPTVISQEVSIHCASTTLSLTKIAPHHRLASLLITNPYLCACKSRDRTLFIYLGPSIPAYPDDDSLSSRPFSIQYRMHPEISILPSSLFYQSRLLDGPNMADKTQKPWHSNARFGVYRFFNTHRGREETTLRHSYKNNIECQVAVALYNRLVHEYTYDFDSKIGIVSMYKAQVDALRSAFVARFGESIKKIVDFNTVDGFQGQEKEIIILSCVRAGPGVTSVGFLSGKYSTTLLRSDKLMVRRCSTNECRFDPSEIVIVRPRSRGHFGKKRPNMEIYSQ